MLRSGSADHYWNFIDFLFTNDKNKEKENFLSFYINTLFSKTSVQFTDFTHKELLTTPPRSADV